MRAALLACLASGALLLAPALAQAHKPSDSYLSLDPTAAPRAVRATWDVALRDLDYVLALDRDGDGAITRGELRARAADVTRYALDHLTFSLPGSLPVTPDRACVADTGALDVVEHSDGAYVRLPVTVTCPATADHAAGVVPAASALDLDYRLFFDVDPQHRGIVRITGGEDPAANALPIILGARDHHRTFSLAAATRAPSALRSMVAAGARHIAGGFDHLLFLLALLLPAVLRRSPDGRGWAPVADLGAALTDVGRVVTAFTVAHSLTLTLAVLGLARMPAHLVEPAIAASVAIAAANNLWPLFGRDRWAVAFALGLLHGFGFSSALADGGFSGAGLATALVGFNLGVELGQLALCAVFVPLAFAARRTLAYRRIALTGGSCAALALALIWFVERSLDVRLLTGSS